MEQHIFLFWSLKVWGKQRDFYASIIPFGYLLNDIGKGAVSNFRL